LVRTLFTLARHHAPSTVFLDEIDAVFGSRDGVESSPGGSSGSSGSTVGSVGNDHEASRRMKTELLIQLDGVSRVGDEDGLVFLLAATNLPWALDNALLRRLEKRIFVDLPNLEARRAMFTKLLAPHTMDEPRTELLDKLATHTENFSGSDVTTLCKECAMRPLRRLMVKLDALGALDGTATTDDDGSTNATDDENAADIASIGEITMDDVSGALSQTRSTHTEAHARRYTQWTESFGTAT
jgi:katanin p60 ATPase-containing subunit A1